MNEETKQTLRELRVILVIILIFIFLGVLITSTHFNLGPIEAFTMVLTQILTAGTGGVLGNIFYVVIIFLTLGITFYMFEKIIILLSELRIGGILMKLSLSSIKDNYIVCGGGKVGTHAAERLKKGGRKVVIIEIDCPTAEFLKNRGYKVLEGDCMSEETLEKAKIRTAKGILACTGKDNINVFVVLTAKDLNQKIRIATRVNDLRSRNEFERAGANIIVTPDITGGYELADKMISKE